MSDLVYTGVLQRPASVIGNHLGAGRDRQAPSPIPSPSRIASCDTEAQRLTMRRAVRVAPP